VSGRPPRRRWWRTLRPPRKLQVLKEGKFFILMTIALGMAAINTGNNLLYLLLGWLLSAIVGSGVLSDLSLRGLRVSRKAPPQLFANRPFLMEVAVANEKSTLSSYALEVEDLVGGEAIDKRCFFLKVPAGRTQRTFYRHTLPRRGAYRLTGFRVASKFPFGLFRKSRKLDDELELLVYPQVSPVPPPPPRARNLGETAIDNIGRHGEFFGLREYREGDDRRAIHWPSSARTEALMVREYEHEAQQRAVIVVDNALPEHASPAARDGLERAISLAASLANTYVQLGHQVALVARGSHVAFAGGSIQLARILRALALLPTVEPGTAYARGVDPGVNSVLVVPPGRGHGAPPAGITHVLEATSR
jgi:uncharacterized protein (DUF58 family)